jgi:hypothetical protein
MWGSHWCRAARMPKEKDVNGSLGLGQPKAKQTKQQPRAVLSLQRSFGRTKSGPPVSRWGWRGIRFRPRRIGWCAADQTVRQRNSGLVQARGKNHPQLMIAAPMIFRAGWLLFTVPQPRFHCGGHWVGQPKVSDINACTFHNSVTGRFAQNSALFRSPSICDRALSTFVSPQFCC